MEFNSTALISALIGSCSTILITKVAEYIQGNQAHTLSLKKEYFNRKINVFEKTVSYFTTAHITMTGLATLLKSTNNENVTFTDEQHRLTFSKLGETIQEIYKTTQETANAIELYFDLKRDQTEVDQILAFWDALGAITQLSIEVSAGYDLLPIAKTTEDYQKMHAAIEMSSQALKSNIENFVNLSNDLRKRYVDITSQLRENLKKYE